MSTHENTATDQALGTVILLPDDEASLSNQIIMDYFTNDGPQGGILDASDYNPERSILDESSGDEDFRESGERLEKPPEEHEKKAENDEKENMGPPAETLIERAEVVFEETLTWEIMMPVLVVILTLAHCIWSLVETAALCLEFGN